MVGVTRALVCGAGGFIGGHLVDRLVEDGCWVRGVDAVDRRYGPSNAHEYVVADLRDEAACAHVLEGGFDEVYQLAADMGGMEFISAAESEIMRNNALINLNMVEAAANGDAGVYFFASSVCVYRDMHIGETVLPEEGAYPAEPDNEYGWEKLYAERVAQTYGRNRDLAVRIGRFENCYGPQGAWRGGREKAPAALCRKVAEAADGGSIEVFGGGSTRRTFVYVADLVDAVIMLVRSDEARPTNIGPDDSVTIRELVETVADVAGKRITIESVPGPLGVESRNFSHDRLGALGWKPQFNLHQGIEQTYPWIAEQVERASRLEPTFG
jgi:GDP-D-mannose 3', 5'-epimerase